MSSKTSKKAIPKDEVNITDVNSDVSVSEVKDAQDAFSELQVAERGSKKVRKHKKGKVNITFDDLKNDSRMLELARQIVEESKQDVPTSNERIANEVFKIEPDTLFTARHFASKLKISFTATYNLMDRLSKQGKVKILVMPNGRKYYTSVNNSCDEYVV